MLKIDEPIIYKATVPVRFSDIDRYNHVNTTCYIDYVFTARSRFCEKEFKLSVSDFEKKGILFYTKRIEINFNVPIPSNQSEIWVESYATTIDGARVSIDFKIETPEKSLVFANGSFDIVFIDAKTFKPMKDASWVHQYIYRE